MVGDCLLAAGSLSVIPNCKPVLQRRQAMLQCSMKQPWLIRRQRLSIRPSGTPTCKHSQTQRTPTCTRCKHSHTQHTKATMRSSWYFSRCAHHDNPNHSIWLLLHSNPPSVHSACVAHAVLPIVCRPVCVVHGVSCILCPSSLFPSCIPPWSILPVSIFPVSVLHTAHSVTPWVHLGSWTTMVHPACVHPGSLCHACS